MRDNEGVREAAGSDVDLVLRALRAWVNSGTSRAEIQAATGLTASNLSRYLSGERRPTPTAAQALRAAIPAHHFPRPKHRAAGPPRVFISSTYLDNIVRRQAVEDAILRAGGLALNMERWSSSEQPLLAHCLDQLQSADVLVGILAYRYGSIPPGQERSITELEFDFAEQQGIDRLVFIIDERLTPRDNDSVDTGAERWKKQDLLDQFKDRLRRSECTPVTFTDDRLGVLVFQALTEWQTRRRLPVHISAPATETDELKLQLAPYFDRVIAGLGQMRIAGFVTPLRTSLDIGSLHVPLYLDPAEMSALEDRGKALMEHDEYLRLKSKHGKPLPDGPRAITGSLDVPERRVTLASALGDLFEPGSELRAVVLLGDPGAGKTTLLKQAAVTLAQYGPGHLGLPKNVVPIFVELRALRPEHAQFEDLVRERLAALAPRLSIDLLDEDLGQRLLFLVDGLDEVPEQRRAEVRGWLEAYLEPKRPERLVLSSRIMGYRGSARLRPGQDISVLEVRPLRIDQRDRLIRNWYRAVELCHAGPLPTNDPQRAAAEAQAQAAAERLIVSLDAPSAWPIRDLAANPLLLSTLCLIHRDRRAELPERRSELYDEAINCLLELWQTRQDIRRHVTLTARQARQVLEPLALWMHTRQCIRVGIDEDGFLPTLQQAMRRCLLPAEFTPERFLATIRDESGLLTGMSGDEYGFLHLRFQEHLAARELRRDVLRNAGDPAAFEAAIQNRLVQFFQDSWWKEVLASLFADPDSEPLYATFQRLLLRTELPVEAREQHRILIYETPYFEPRPFTELLSLPLAKGLADQRRFAVEVLLKRDSERLTVFDWTPYREELARHGRLTGEKRARAESTPAGVAARLTLGALPESIARQDLGRVPATARNGQPPKTATAVDSATGLIFAPIPAGEFPMGSDENREPERGAWEWNPHPVRLPAFEMAITPVTNDQYRLYLSAVKGAATPDFWEQNRFNQPDQPVVGVSWEQADAYCRWATSQMPDGYLLRLPSESEWEYACRAGTQTRYWSGDSEEDLSKAGWYRENSGGVLHAVREKPANPWGLFDMHGNVWEWCSDWWCHAESKHADKVKSLHPAPCSEAHQSAPNRVFRGGCFAYEARGARSASRGGLPPGYRSTSLGFRPVRVTP